MLGNVSGDRVRLRRMYVNGRSRVVRHSLYSVNLDWRLEQSRRLLGEDRIKRNEVVQIYN